jgi:hypothetical protein
VVVFFVFQWRLSIDLSRMPNHSTSATVRVYHYAGEVGIAICKR